MFKFFSLLFAVLASDLVTAQFTPAFIPIDHKGEAPSTSMMWVKNNGQASTLDGLANPAVLYYSFGGYPRIAAMVHNTISINLQEVDTLPETPDPTWSFHIMPIGETVNTNVVPQVFEELAEKQHFFLSHCPWGITNVPSFKRIVYEGIYPGIDMHLYSNSQGLKIYFVFNPGSNPEDLRLKFMGQDEMHIDLTGVLKVIKEDKFIRLPEALAYQEVDGETQLISWGLNYTHLEGDDRVGFQFEDYDHDHPLILDISASLGLPPTFGLPPEWGTYYGDASEDNANNVEVLNNGNFVTCGQTGSLGFPTTAGAFSTIFTGTGDAFYSLFGPDYNRLYTTFYGGNGDDSFGSIAFTPDQQSVYLAGRTLSTNLAVTSFGAGSFQDASNGGESVMLVRFPLDVLEPFPEWRTYFGSNSMRGPNIVTDALGALYLSGWVGTTLGFDGELACQGTEGTFPYCNALGAGAYLQDFWGGGIYDAFFAKFNPQLSLVHSTLFGGVQYEGIYDLAVDNSLGQVFWAGYTRSRREQYTNCQPPTNGGFPLCDPGNGYFQDDYNWLNTQNSNFLDGTIGSFSTTTGALTWATYIGSVHDEVAHKVEVDEQQNKVYLTGITTAPSFASNNCDVPTTSNFPRCNTAPQYEGVPGAGNGDVFLMRFNAATHQLEWSAVLGGSERDDPLSLSLLVDESGGKKLVVGGFTTSGSSGSTGIPVLNNTDYYFQDAHGDAAATDGPHYDSYVWVFDKEQQFIMGTYVGGVGDDRGLAVAAGGDDRVYQVGEARSTAEFPFNCPPTVDPWCDQSYANTLNGSADASYVQLKYDVTVGFEEEVPVYQPSFALYPVPSNGTVTVRGNGEQLPSDLRIEVIDAVGRMAYRQSEPRTVAGRSATLHLSDLPDGVYFARLSSASTGVSAVLPFTLYH